ncbi:MAG: YidB family protein [Brachymonas sp.]
MGLLDSVLGAVMGGAQQQAGGAGGGLAALLPVVTEMLANGGQQGGLGGLMEKFNQAGMGDVMGSWVGKGENMPISADQLSQVLGSGAIGDIAAKLGVDANQAGGMLSQVLPGLIDQLTPDGQAPAGGLGGAGDLMGMLGKLMQK